MAGAAKAFSVEIYVLIEGQVPRQAVEQGCLFIRNVVRYRRALLTLNGKGALAKG